MFLHKSCVLAGVETFDICNDLGREVQHGRVSPTEGFRPRALVIEQVLLVQRNLKIATFDEAIRLKDIPGKIGSHGGRWSSRRVVRRTAHSGLAFPPALLTVKCTYRGSTMSAAETRDSPSRQ